MKGTEFLSHCEAVDEILSPQEDDAHVRLKQFDTELDKRALEDRLSVISQQS